MRNIPSAELYRSNRQIVTVVACNYGFSQSQIRQGTFTYDSRIVEGESFQVGTAIADEIHVVLDNTDGVYGKNAIGEEFEVYLSTEGGSERYLLGTFVCVDAQESAADVSELVMQDKMILFDKVIPSFTFGWTVRKCLVEFCNEVKVPVRLTEEEDAFLRTLFIREAGNEQSVTYRDFIRGVALIMCENAYITNTGYLAFKSIHDYGETFTASERFSSEVGEKAQIGGLVVLDNEGGALFNEGIEGAFNIVIDPSSSVILDLIGGLTPLVDKYEMQETLPIPGRAIFGREYYPLGMATLSWWEVETGDIVRYVSKGGEVYPSIVTSCASVLNGKTSITSVADKEARDIPTQTDAIRTTTKALADAADDASKVATNYMTFSQETGLDVGYVGTDAKTRISGDGVEIFDGNGVSMEYIGSQDNHPYARIGYESQGYMETSNGGLDLKYNGNEIAHMGWGETNADPFWGGGEPGTTEMAPYYTFGDRAPMFEDNDNVEHDAYVGQNSFVTGKMGVAIGPWSYVGGYGNVATDQFQTVVGYWNDPDEPGSFVVGAGSSPVIGQRANALVVGGQRHAVMIHGDTYIDGGLTAKPKSNSRSIQTVSGITVGSLQVYTSAGWCAVTLEITSKTTLSDWATIATGMPIPEVTWYDTMTNWENTYHRPYRVAVTTSGNLNIRYGAGSSSDATAYRISFVYPMAT